MALGSVLVLAALIGGFVLLLGGGDDGTDPEDGVERSSLTEFVRSPALGLSALYPPDWRRVNRGELIQLKSPDRCVTISFSAPADARDAERLRRDAIAALRESFAQSRVRPLPAASAGSETTAGALVAGRGKDGKNAAVRVTVTRSAKLAHLTSVFLRPPPCEASIPEAEAILSSIEYTK